MKQILEDKEYKKWQIKHWKSEEQERKEKKENKKKLYYECEKCHEIKHNKEMIQYKTINQGNKIKCKECDYEIIKTRTHSIMWNIVFWTLYLTMIIIMIKYL